MLVGQLLLVRRLRGLAPDVPLSDGERVDEDGFERQLESDPLLVLPAGKYWIRKLQARFYMGDYPAALEAARKAQRYAGIAPGELPWPTTSSTPRSPGRDRVRPRHPTSPAASERSARTMRSWRRGPRTVENFADRAALVGLNRASRGSGVDAERL